MTKRLMLTLGRALLAVAIVGLISTSLGACETVKGAGEDLKSIGEAGQEALEGDEE